MTSMALTQKQKVFVAQYLLTLNATEAARRAKYKDPEQAGYENKRKQEVAQAISAGLAELAMPSDELLARVSDQARGSLDDFLRIERVTYHQRHPIPAPTEDDPKAVEWVEDPVAVEKLVVDVDLEQAKQRGKLHLLKKVKWGQWGPEIEIYDAHAAQALLARHHGLLTDKQEISGPGGGPIPVREVVVRLPDAQPLDT